MSTPLPSLLRSGGAVVRRPCILVWSPSIHPSILLLACLALPCSSSFPQKNIHIFFITERGPELGLARLTRVILVDSQDSQGQPGTTSHHPHLPAPGCPQSPDSVKVQKIKIQTRRALPCLTLFFPPSCLSPVNLIRRSVSWTRD